MASVETGSQSIDRAARILVRLIESDDAVTLGSVVIDLPLAFRICPFGKTKGILDRLRLFPYRHRPMLPLSYTRVLGGDVSAVQTHHEGL